MKNYGPVAALAALLWLSAPNATQAADEPKPAAEQDKPDKKDEKPTAAQKADAGRLPSSAPNGGNANG